MDTQPTVARNSHSHWLALIAIVAFVFVGSFVVADRWRSESEQFAAILPISGRPSRSSGAIVGAEPRYILVGFSEGLSAVAKENILRRQNLVQAETRDALAAIGVERVALLPGDLPERAAERMRRESNVQFAEVDALLEPSFIPDDPYFPNQWHHSHIGTPAAWDFTRGEQVVVAVADTGVNAEHPDLAGNVVAGWSVVSNSPDTTDENGHGTAVAGTIAAVGNNGIGGAGGAYRTTILPIKIAGANGLASYSSITNSILYAADHGAKVVNVSYAAGDSNVVGRAARYLKRNGGILVISEGNSGSRSPAKNNADIISVSALDVADVITGWSTYGADVDVSAPGLAILSTTKTGAYAAYSGTSFSAPLAAGVLALVWSANPSLSPDAAMQILFDSATDLGPAGWDEWYGWGQINAQRAVTLAIERSVDHALKPGKGKSSR